MSTGSDDSFIKDLYNATVLTNYYDAITDSVWYFSISKRFRSHFAKLLSILDELFEENT